MGKRVEQMAKDHWDYVKKVLKYDGIPPKTMTLIGFHYQSAFIHGYKHGREVKMKRRSKYDHHHIVPRSRDKKKVKDPHNIVKVERHRHECYHLLFGNKTPDEIIRMLVNEFWGGDYMWVHKAIDELELYP